MFHTDNRDNFHRRFLDGLHTMLEADELGAFILVLANSMQDQQTHEGLKQQLLAAYERHLVTSQQAAEDDIAVFDSLSAADVTGTSVWKFHRRTSWLQLINPMRALRPARASAVKVDSIRSDFDADRFHFNKPFLKPEILSQEFVSNAAYSCDVTVLYNKFPFMPYHTLLVPEAQACHAQYLSHTMHCFVWHILDEANLNNPGSGFGYNSIGACASVNHLHFQGFVFEDELPVESDCWTHNGGERDYPVSCERYDDVDECWSVIEQLHVGDQPYNLLYREACCYVFARAIQGSAGVRPRVQGAGWSELAGVFNEPDIKTLQTIPEAEIEADLRSLSVA